MEFCFTGGLIRINRMIKRITHVCYLLCFNNSELFAHVFYDFGL